MNFTPEDEYVIAQYIRDAHPGYTGPVSICMGRLVELHMRNSRRIVKTALIWARHNSKGIKNA